ncbi:MAG: PQQ-binding-like beta-propeller repeat protein [Planctomycetota bacterium]
MALKGDLASVDLAQVFQMLALNQKVGMLSIQSPGTWKALYFDQRGVTLYFNEHLVLDRVLGNMIRTGQVQAETVTECRDHSAAQGVSVVDSLLAGGFVTEPELETAFRREMEEEIYDLFFWRDARFEFFEGATGFEGREGTINERFFFTTDSLIMEAARRIDEWAYIKERVAGPEEIYRPIENNTNVLKLDDTALAVLELVDGKRNVARLIEITAMSAFHVYKSLAQLLDEESVEQIEASGLIDAAKECVAEGRLQDAINIYERAITLSVGLPETHALVAQAYETTQEFELAAYHLKCVAEYYASDGDIEEAVKLLQHVVSILPTDLATRERIVELTVGAPEFKTISVNSVAEGKVLVDLYLEIDELDRVRGILERLLNDNPNDLELKKSLISIHSKAGDTRRVIELYESIAEDLVRESNPIEAIKYLHKILMIDRSRRDISDRIRSLYELDERRRSRRRAMAALGALLCVLAALAGAWFFYEQHARDQFETLKVERLIEEGEFDAAIGLYQAFLESYPFTLVAKDAKAGLLRVESQRLAHDAEVQRERAERDAEKNRMRTRYRLAWDHYQTEIRAKNLAAALERLETCRRLVTEAGEEVDAKWSDRVQLEKSIGDLRAYIGEAAALERTARELLAKNDWRRARDKLIELTTDYGMTEVARRARIPVLLATRPAGARVFKDGEPVRRRSQGVEEELRTPAVVFCHQEIPEEFGFQLEGFESRTLTVAALDSDVAHCVMTVVPDAIIGFEVSPHTPVGVGGLEPRYVVSGLRGGRVGVALADGTGQLPTVQLDGLREVVGTPVVARDRFLFRTNEAELACHRLDGRLLWRAPLRSPPSTDPVVVGGRVFVVDLEGRLICLDQERGEVLWRNQNLPDVVAGPPVVVQRHVRIGTVGGDYLLLDVLHGEITNRLSGLPRLSAGPLYVRGVAIFGTEDGRVLAIDESNGQVAWAAAVGREVRHGEMILTDDSVLVIGGDQTLVKLGLRDGARHGSFPMPGRPLSGPVCVGDKVFVTVREAVDAKTKRDLLIALEAETLETMWEYRDGGLFAAGLSADGSAVYLPDSDTSVLRFR